MNQIKKEELKLKIPRWVTIIAHRLNFTFQPNRGSSLYRLPSKKKILIGQEDWNCPVGTLRFSDHWSYSNWKEEVVYCTNELIPSKAWAICVNTNIRPNPWKVIQIFQKRKGCNLIQTIDFEKIQKEINLVLG